jgi:membrane associated rhomboid family serine protease
MSHEPNRAGTRRKTLVWAIVVFAVTAACSAAAGIMGGVLWGSAVEGAIAGAIWGLILGLVWVLPLAFLGRSSRAKKKWYGDSPRENMRDPGRFGGPESGGFF